MLMALFTYSVDVFCSVRVWLHMRTHLAKLEASRTKAISNQLNMVLLFQALTSLCVEILPSTSLAVVSNLDYSTLVSSSMVTLLLNRCEQYSHCFVCIEEFYFGRRLVSHL